MCFGNIGGNCNNLDSQSQKFRRLLTYSMAAEVFAFVKAFKMAYLISNELRKTYVTSSNLYMFTDFL